MPAEHRDLHAVVDVPETDRAALGRAVEAVPLRRPGKFLEKELKQDPGIGGLPPGVRLEAGMLPVKEGGPVITVKKVTYDVEVTIDDGPPQRMQEPAWLEPAAFPMPYEWREGIFQPGLPPDLFKDLVWTTPTGVGSFTVETSHGSFEVPIDFFL